MSEKKKKRLTENDYEEMRKDITQNVVQNIKVNPSYKVARFVDKSVIEKTVLSQYGRWKSSMGKMELPEPLINHKRTNNQTAVGKKLIASDIPMDVSFEKLYFDTFGVGLDGKDTPTPIHQTYRCQYCGLQFRMDTSMVDYECPRCRKKTFMANVIDKKLYKKW